LRRRCGEGWESQSWGQPGSTDDFLYKSFKLFTCSAQRNGSKEWYVLGLTLRLFTRIHEPDSAELMDLAFSYWQTWHKSGLASEPINLIDDCTSLNFLADEWGVVVGAKVSTDGPERTHLCRLHSKRLAIIYTLWTEKKWSKTFKINYAQTMKCLLTISFDSLLNVVKATSDRLA
jgi:hypothetical protein